LDNKGKMGQNPKRKCDVIDRENIIERKSSFGARVAV
jgi:hypothetical protein